MGRIYNKSTKKVLASSFERADSFISRGRGLMCRRAVREPLVFVFDSGRARGRTACAIHSLLVFFPFSAIYLDERKKVVDVRVCRPFFSFVVPKKESAYLIEGIPELAEGVRVGDVVEFD